MELIIQDHSVHYTVRGSGFPLVILHGFMIDHEVMLHAFEPLLTDRPNIQRIYIDMPGMGRTPPHDDLCSSNAIADLLVEFLDTLLPDQPFMLAGFSYGGYIARGILAARQARVAGLLLLAPTVLGEDGARDIPEQLVVVDEPGVASMLPEPLASMILGTLSVRSKAVVARIVDEYMASFPRADQAFLAKLRQPAQYSFGRDIDALPTPFDQPALVLTGRHDTSVGYANAFAVARRYPRATYAALDRAGHGVYLEQDGLFRALVAEWLDRVAEAQPVPQME